MKVNIVRTLSSGVLSRRCELKISSGTLYRVALARSDISENLSFRSSLFLKLISFHGNTSLETSQLWNPEERDDRFSETSVRASVTRYKVPEDIFN
jgi:hypothetical protein